MTHGNINGQGSFSAWSISPSHNFAPAEEENSMTRANLTAQHNGYSSSLMTAAPGGVSQGTSSLNHDQAGISGLYPIEEWLGVEEAHVADQDFIPADNGMQFSMPMITTVITSVDLSSAAKSQGLAIISFLTSDDIKFVYLHNKQTVYD
uniref:Uncharacterized protein n=1 Tax=Aegilops tauschii subsp. strangulata TaxID=200361 RepID=A0A453LYC8_AEGTS